MASIYPIGYLLQFVICNWATIGTSDVFLVGGGELCHLYFKYSTTIQIYLYKY